jgi:putative transposase
VEAQKEEVDLRDRIERMVVECARYGYRRVTWQLRPEGRKVNHKRVQRIMREQFLPCQVKRKWVRTTDGDHGLSDLPESAQGP